MEHPKIEHLRRKDQTRIRNVATVIAHIVAQYGGDAPAFTSDHYRGQPVDNYVDKPQQLIFQIQPEQGVGYTEVTVSGVAIDNPAESVS